MSIRVIRSPLVFTVYEHTKRTLTNPATISNTSSQWVSLHRWQRVKLEEPTQHFYANRARYHCSILETVPYHIFKFRFEQFKKLTSEQLTFSWDRWTLH